MERTKRERASFRAQYIPVEEMFSMNELMDLKQAFEAVSQGEAYVNILSLKALFAEMNIFPSDEMLVDLLKSCGKSDEDINIISFDLFARAVALLLEENIDKGSTSSN
jgi:Ca2+-binding EF-hand superfamily protein